MPTWVNNDNSAMISYSIPYEEYFGTQGQSGWELAFSNDGSGATRTLDIPITFHADTDFPPNAGPQYIGQIHDAVKAFVGYPVVIPIPGRTGNRTSWIDGPVAQISRVLPMPFPNLFRLLYANPPGTLNDDEDQPFLYMTRIPRISGVGPGPTYTPNNTKYFKSQNIDGNDLSIHQKVRMQCQFEALPYFVVDDDHVTRQITTIGSGGGNVITFSDESLLLRYVSRIPKPNADYFSVQNGVMRFAEGASGPMPSIGRDKGLPLPFTVGRIISHINMTIRWHDVPEEAIATQSINPSLDPTKFETAIDYSLGRVNDQPFPYPNGYPAGTLLLLAVGMVPFNATSGRRLYNVDFMFKFLQSGHHKIYSFLDATHGNDFVEISSDGQPYGPIANDGKHLYNNGNFNQLFWPPKIPDIGE